MDALNRWLERSSRGVIQVPTQEHEEQCWECRITGTVALYGTSAAAFRYWAMASRKTDFGNRVFFGALGITFAVLGTYRMLTPTRPVDLAETIRRREGVMASSTGASPSSGAPPGGWGGSGSGEWEPGTSSSVEMGGDELLDPSRPRRLQK